MQSRAQLTFYLCTSLRCWLWRTGAYKCNCSDAEANSWHGRSSAAVGKQQAASKAPATTAKVALIAPSAVLISPLQAATANTELAQMPSGTLVAAAQPQQAVAVPTPIAAAAPATAVAQHVGSALKVSKPFRSTATPSGFGTGLGTGPSSNKRQVVRAPVLLQPGSAEDLAARPDRESIGGTQGAITGLTHLALQKHNQDLHLRTGSADHSAVSGLDTQQMALQASFSRLTCDHQQSCSAHCIDPSAEPLLVACSAHLVVICKHC